MPLHPREEGRVDEDLQVRVTAAQFVPATSVVPVDIALVYCLDVEEDAVRGAWFAGEDAIARPLPPSYRRFHQAAVKLKGRAYHAVACKSADQGGLDMQTALQDLHLHFAPRVTCLVGIAGALDPELLLGEVVLASRVYHYERGKENAAGVARELRAFAVDTVTRNLLEGVLADMRRDKNAPSVRWATYGTGEKVVASELASVREYLTVVDRKIAAVDMESGGFFHYFHETPFRADGEKWLVIKGVSDHADESKTDSEQPLAAERSARAAFHVAAALLRELDSASSDQR